MKKSEIKRTVFLSEFIHPDARRKLDEEAAVVNTLEQPEDIDAIILRGFRVDAGLMDRCPNLKVIGKHGVGCDSIDLEAARKRGIPVVCTPRANTNSVAELIVGLMLDISRGITAANNKAFKGQVKTIAPKEMTGTELSGKTLGLIGAGNIARRVAEILTNGFGVKVVAYDPYVDAEAMEKSGYIKCGAPTDVIKQSDLINVSVPLTPETRDLISGEVFDYFRPNAILVNAARGGIVNEDDLYMALKSHKLRAAACDAFVNEPPSAANTRLYELENFIGTPHIGAATEEALYRMGTEIVSEVLDVLDGKPPRNRVV